jgi:hypothetical protein
MYVVRTGVHPSPKFVQYVQDVQQFLAKNRAFLQSKNFNEFWTVANVRY